MATDDLVLKHKGINIHGVYWMLMRWTNFIQKNKICSGKTLEDKICEVNSE